MRRHFVNQLALENEDPDAAAAAAAAGGTGAPQGTDPAVIEEPTLSLEEEQLLLDEAEALRTDIGADMEEAARLLETSDAIEDLAVVAEPIEAATPTELQLLETAGQMAVAGSDVPAEEIVPAMESFLGKKINVQTLRDTAKRIWESIQTFLKQVWEKIEAWFYNRLGVVPRRRASIRKLKEVVGTLKDKSVPADAKQSLPSGRALLVNNVQITDGAKLEAELKKLDKALTYTTGAWTDAFTKRAEAVAGILENFDVVKSEEAAQAAIDKVKAIPVPAVPGGKPLKAFGNHDSKRGEALLGNIALVSRDFRDDKGHATQGSLELLRLSGVHVDHMPMLPTKQTGDIKPLTPEQMTKLLAAAEKLLDSVEDYQRGNTGKKVSDTRRNLQAASDKATDSFKNNVDGSASIAIANYRSLLNFNAAYTNWARNPSMPLISATLAAVNGVIALVAGSAKLYK